MSVRARIINTTLAIQAARVLEREARQLHDSYTIVGKPASWESPDAKRDHDEYLRIAKALRAAPLAPGGAT